MLRRFQRSLRPNAPWMPPVCGTSSISVTLPHRVRGSRRVSMATKGHNSSIVVDPNDGAAKDLESSIEHAAYLTLCADPKVKGIQCQAPPIDYVDQDGEVHEHTFDFLVTYCDGFRDAVMVKHADKVRRADLETFAAQLAEQLPDGFADDVLLINNEDLPEWLLSNARLVRSARLDQPSSLDREIADRAADLFAPVTIDELCRPFAPLGFRSVARLLYSGHLRQLEPGLIEPHTVVVAVAPLSN